MDSNLPGPETPSTAQQLDAMAACTSFLGGANKADSDDPGNRRGSREGPKHEGLKRTKGRYVRSNSKDHCRCERFSFLYPLARHKLERPAACDILQKTASKRRTHSLSTESHFTYQQAEVNVGASVQAFSASCFGVHCKAVESENTGNPRTPKKRRTRKVRDLGVRKVHSQFTS
jgi:hypothetical protein